MHIHIHSLTHSFNQILRTEPNIFFSPEKCGQIFSSHSSTIYSPSHSPRVRVRGLGSCYRAGCAGCLCLCRRFPSFCHLSSYRFLTREKGHAGPWGVSLIKAYQCRGVCVCARADPCLWFSRGGCKISIWSNWNLEIFCWWDSEEGLINCLMSAYWTH